MKSLGTIMLTAVLLAASMHAVQAQLPALQVEQNQLDRANPRQAPREEQQANVRINDLQAISMAKERFEGAVLRISLIGEGFNRRYQIRMENEGKVFTVFVHANTGRITGGN